VSDGISMGTAGMRFSLPSRDIIADSIETVVSAQWYDGLIAVVGCDKNMPGALMALGRLNRPGILVYGGTIAPGCHAGKNLDVVSAFEALGQKLSGEINQETFEQCRLKACPGSGCLWWYVHCQYDGICYRSMGYVTTLWLFQSCYQ
jgi:dihydroxy-acid dehydratase